MGTRTAPPWPRRISVSPGWSGLDVRSSRWWPSVRRWWCPSRSRGLGSRSGWPAAGLPPSGCSCSAGRFVAVARTALQDVRLVPLERRGQGAGGEVQVNDAPAFCGGCGGRRVEQERFHGENPAFGNAAGLEGASGELGNAVGG